MFWSAVARYLELVTESEAARLVAEATTATIVAPSTMHDLPAVHAHLLIITAVAELTDEQRQRPAGEPLLVTSWWQQLAGRSPSPHHPRRDTTS